MVLSRQPVLSAPPSSDRTLSAESLAPLLWGKDDWCQAHFRAMGTSCQLIYRPPSRKQGMAFRDAALAWLTDFEAKYSRYRDTSMISAINRAAGESWVETDAELDGIFALCDHYHWSTGGVFDPSSLPLLRLWSHQVEQPTVPSDAAIAAALKLVGWNRVQRQPGRVYLPEKGMAIDLGGIGKEYAVDRVFEQSKPFGITDIMIDFGRDVRAAGQAPQGGAWRVGLEHPTDPERCWGGVQISHRAVTTSGDYLRGFHSEGRYYSHIIDPRTGRPIDNGCTSVSIIAPTCTEAGVLSTSALVLGREEGLRLIERATLAQGCLWQGETRYDTGRFSAYIL